MSTNGNGNYGNGNISDQDRIALICEITRLWPFMKKPEHHALLGLTGGSAAFSDNGLIGVIGTISNVKTNHGEFKPGSEVFIFNATSTLMTKIRERIEPVTVTPPYSDLSKKIQPTESNKMDIKPSNDMLDVFITQSFISEYPTVTVSKKGDPFDVSRINLMFVGPIYNTFMANVPVTLTVKDLLQVVGAKYFSHASYDRIRLDIRRLGKTIICPETHSSTAYTKNSINFWKLEDGDKIDVFHCPL